VETPERVETMPPETLAVRLLFVSEQTGGPVAGLEVRLESGDREGGAVLGRLQTDRAGYASFKVAAPKAGERLRVAWGDGRAEPLVLETHALASLAHATTVAVDGLAVDLPRPGTGLPAVMAPDALDAELSPGSIGMVPQILPGAGLCAQIMPTTLSVRRFRAFQILADICHTQHLHCDKELEIAHGRMLEYEVVWHPLGTSLGDLLNSIPLAPCEQANVAVLDWMRREAAARGESTQESQQQTQSMQHDRLVHETMGTLAHQSSTAFGAALATGVDLEGSLFGFKAGIHIGTTFGFSSTSSTSDISASTTSSLSEQITQSATLVANRRSTVVFQANAEEHRTYQTRTIRNNNHCHTVTFLYYQVNQAYRVVTYFRGERPILLVRYPNAAWDAERAFCNASVLKPALLDPSLAHCFDELADALYCCDHADVPKGASATALQVTARVLANHNARDVRLVLQTTSGNAAADPVQTGGWIEGGVYSQTVALNPPVDPASVSHLAAFVTPGGVGTGSIDAASVDVKLLVAGHPDPIPLLSGGQTQLQTGWTAAAAAKMPGEGSGCADASCCVRQLVAHLNCHRRYYNSVAWMNEDPNDRIMRWGCCAGDGAVPLLFTIAGPPLAVYGDFVAFAQGPVQPGPFIAPTSTMVTLPTPGVYSEGVLGRCGTCETVDPNTFWDWKDSPCTDNAPAIGDPPDPQTGTGAGSLKPDGIANLISFATPPAAPGSVLSEVVKALIAKSDTGSEGARALLLAMLDAAKASIGK
jgi:hypothetical protein